MADLVTEREGAQDEAIGPWNGFRWGTGVIGLPHREDMEIDRPGERAEGSQLGGVANPPKVIEFPGVRSLDPGSWGPPPSPCSPGTEGFALSCNSLLPPTGPQDSLACAPLYHALLLSNVQGWEGPSEGRSAPRTQGRRRLY